MASSGDTSAPKFARGTDTDDGDYTTALVTGVTGKKIRLLQLAVSVLTTAGTVAIKSSGGSTLLTHHVALGVPLVLGAPGIPVCESVTGEGILPSNGTGVDSFISATYVEVEP